MIGENSNKSDLTFALGNEIPPGVVRWHGRVRVERFLRRLYEEAKAASPTTLFTYVNFPPTEFLDLSFFDVCAFNVYLHREAQLRAYIARLQHVASHKPLLLAEAGADSIREGETGQARLTAMHVRAAFEEGACGAIAFAWTDEWWRGGHPVDDWKFGLVDGDRRLKPAATAVAAAFADAPFSREQQKTWPMVSAVICAYNAADTLDDCLTSLERLTYPDYEIVLVNDGSRDRTSEIAHSHPRVRVIDIPNRGLSAARNVGLAAARGGIVAYTDADTRVDRDWLTFLVQPFLVSNVVGSGGPNVVPPDDSPIAQCIARAPGGPTHVLLDDRTAEHVPGCNMAFYTHIARQANGFDPQFRKAGDDVDFIWRLQHMGCFQHLFRPAWSAKRSRGPHICTDDVTALCGGPPLPATLANRTGSCGRANGDRRALRRNRRGIRPGARFVPPLDQPGISLRAKALGRVLGYRHPICRSFSHDRFPRILAWIQVDDSR